MEGNRRWLLVGALGPVMWGATYYVTRHALPPGDPLYGAVLRALPAGLVLLALRRRLPHGAWWWRSLVLGVLNTGAFFALVYVAAQTLPTSVASTIMATSSAVMMLAAWALLGQRPRAVAVAGAVLGIAGVAAMLLTGSVRVAPGGVAASVAAMTMSSIGYVLATRWGHDVDVLSSTAWQLVAGGLVVLPLAVAVEGAPPALDGTALLGFAFVSLAATALAFVAWFAALRHLGPSTVGLLGLLNPVTGVLLGTVLASESLSLRQGLGIALVLAGVVTGTRRPAARTPASAAAGTGAGSGSRPGATRRAGR